MQFIVIEKFNGDFAIVTDEDGETKVFDTKAEAQTEADDCQDGQVVEV